MKLARIRRSSASTSGVWWDFEDNERLEGPHAQHLSLCIAERDNPTYRDALARPSIERRADMRGLDGDEYLNAWQACVTRAMAEGILVGWANIEDDDGNAIDYSADQAEQFLSDEALWQLRQFVLDASGIADAYRKETAGEVAGNS